MGDLGQIVPTPFEFRDEDSVRAAVTNSTVVVNLVGKVYPTIHYKLEDVHVTAARRLAEIAREEGVPHFVHVSTNVPSVKAHCEWLETKIQGEEAVREVYPDACIIRPTDIFGSEDRFLVRLANNIFMRPLTFVADDGISKVQPVYVNDVATFVAAAARDPEAYAGKILELGGPDVVTIRQCLEFVLESTKRQATLVPVPGLLAQLIGRIEGMRLPVVNPSPVYTGDSVKIELAGNILDTSKSGVTRFEDLGHLPTPVLSDAGSEILRRFRRGGDRSSLFYTE
jgi:NADH dehydrogenase (ubiquinone) 1 alpha subcomplex subunit 9